MKNPINASNVVDRFEDISRESMEDTISAHFFNLAEKVCKTPKMFDFMIEARDKFIELASFDEIEQEFENIVY